MENWLIYTLIGVGLFIISLFFEFMRDIYEDILDFIGDVFEDILGDFGEGLFYVISFEWVGDIPDFFGTMFDDISEFSVYGLVFGIIGFVTIFLLREQMVTPFVSYFAPAAKIFWTIATYVTVFIGGYMMGKFFENS